MKFLVFDTETTGLPQTKILNPDTLHQWPTIVQFSYIIFDLSLNEIIESKDHIIKVPKNIKIPEESAKIHGITNEISSNMGIPIYEVLNEFFNHLINVDVIVGHYISFDINMIKVELLRIIFGQQLSGEQLKNIKYNLHYITNYKNIYCTLQNSVKLCNIPAIDKFGRSYLRYPKLIELHKKLFDSSPNNLHNSFNDILVTLRCFIKIKYNSDIFESSKSFRQISSQINLV